METLRLLIMNNPDIVLGLFSVILTIFGAKITVITTKTRDNKWYKLIELLAMLWGKAKEQANADNKIAKK